MTNLLQLLHPRHLRAQLERKTKKSKRRRRRGKKGTGARGGPDRGGPPPPPAAGSAGGSGSRLETSQFVKNSLNAFSVTDIYIYLLPKRYYLRKQYLIMLHYNI